MLALYTGVWILIGVMFVVAFILAIFALYIDYKNCRVARAELKELKSKYRIMTGSTLHIRYDLRTLGLGDDWYAVNQDSKTKKFEILGKAEEVYPGLLNEIRALEQLKRWVKINKDALTLDSGDPLHDRALLQYAGFEIETPSYMQTGPRAAESTSAQAEAS